MSPDILLARGDAVMRPESGPNPNADRRYRIYYDMDGVPVSVRSTVPFYERALRTRQAMRSLSAII
jgi:hypothetical protein